MSATTDLDPQIEQYRVELTGYCYRMLGSAFEADDAVQETMVRAWKAFDSFEGRSSVRSWLYRIATNVCFDQLNGRQRRARPMDLGPASTADSALGAPAAETTWIEPILDSRVVPESDDPADVAAARESIRLAFLAALQHLPPRQRAVLILRDVLRWSAAESAELLETSVASVNSALQRARATLADTEFDDVEGGEPAGDDQSELLARYVDAFERYDIDAFVSLLTDDAMHTMPPFELWLQGPDEIHKFMLGPGAACEGSRLVPLDVNGSPGFAHYKPNDAGDVLEPWSIQVVELADGHVTGITYFLDTKLFELFGLPSTLDPIG